MEYNWYKPQEEPTGEPYLSPAHTAEPQSPVKRSRQGWKIATILLSVAVLITASCLIFRREDSEETSESMPWGQRGERDEGSFHFSFPGGGEEGEDAEDDFFEDFRDYFDKYYTSFESAEPCTIPTVDAAPGLSIQLVETEEDTLTLQQIYERCSPSIVAISAFTREDSDDYYSWGTGIVLSSDGYIVTNSHIVEGTCRARVTLYDDRELDALLVGYDSRSDIAVLKVDADDLIPAEFGVSDHLQVGQAVAAIGNPLGSSFRCTMTNGIISGIDRDIAYNGTTLTLIQTNAALNEGNSGGALVNMSGQVIGVTNMKMSNSYAGSVTIEGVGFAIPSATVKAMADALLSQGEVTGRPALGVTVGAIPDEAAAHYALPEGLYVSSVAENSDCAAQGIRAGDVITHVNGQAVTATKDVTDIIAEREVGDSLTLTVYRDGKSFDVAVRLVDVNEVY